MILYLLLSFALNKDISAWATFWSNIPVIYLIIHFYSQMYFYISLHSFFNTLSTYIYLITCSKIKSFLFIINERLQARLCYVNHNFLLTKRYLHLPEPTLAIIEASYLKQNNTKRLFEGSISKYWVQQLGR